MPMVLQYYLWVDVRPQRRVVVLGVSEGGWEVGMIIPSRTGAYEFLRELFVPIVEMGEIPEKSPFREKMTQTAATEQNNLRN